MFWARGEVFGHSTPPEEPFLDNPIRYFGWDDSFGVLTNINHWIMGRLTAAKVAARLLYLLICPITLSSDYSYDQIPLFGWNLLKSSNFEAISVVPLTHTASNTKSFTMELNWTIRSTSHIGF